MVNKSLYNKYLRELQTAEVPSGISPALISAAAKQSYIQKQLQDPNSTFNTFSAGPVSSGPPAEESSGGLGSWLLDMISRPLYGVGSAMQANQSSANAGSAGMWAPAPDFSGDSIGTKIAKAAEGFGKGFTGENKVTPGQVEQKNTGLTGVPGFLLGLSADLALDPLNVVPIKKGMDLLGMVRRGDLKTAAELKNEATIAAARERKVTQDVSATGDKISVETPAADTLEPLATKVADNEANEAIKSQLSPELKSQLPEPQYNPRPIDQAVSNNMFDEFGQPKKWDEITKPVVDAATAEKVLPFLDDAKYAVNGELKTTSQAYRMQDIVREVAKAAPPVEKVVGKAVPGSVRAADDIARQTFMKTETMSRLKTAENASENAGTFHHIDSPTDPLRRYELKQSDIIESLSEATQNKLLWTTGAKIKPAALADGAAKAMDLIGVEMSAQAKINTVGHAIWSMSKAKAGKYAGRQISENQAKQLAKELIDKAPELVQKATNNASRQRIKIERDIQALKEAKQADLHRVANDPTIAPSEAAKAVTDTADSITKAAKNLGAASPATIVAAADLAQETAKVVDRGTVALMESADRVGALRAADNVDENAVKAARAKGAKENEESAIQALKEAEPNANLNAEYDMGLTVANERHIAWRDRNSPTVKAIVEINRAVGTHTAISRAIHNFRKLLTGFDKIPRESQIQAFSQIRQGKEVGPEFASLKEAYNTVYDSADSTMAALVRNGATWDQINAVLKAMWSHGNKTNKLPQFKEIKGVDGWKKTANQMQEFVVDDPADFLERSYGALRQLAAHQTVAMSFENKWASKAARPGYVKLTNVDGLIGQHLQTGLYYPKEALEALQHVEHITGRARGFSGSTSAMGKFVDSIYDPVLGVWKAYNTIMRPGHHVRNGIGDAFLSQMRGMINFGKYYKEATQLMLGKTANFSKTVVIDGKSVTLSGDEIMRHFEEMGLRPDYQASEDILGAANEVKRGRVYNALMENPAARFMGGVSEVTGSEGRLAQFIYELGHGENLRGIKDIDQLIAVASRQVRKWHPDSSGILGAEAKYMRRIVPFYSWIRQAIPLVVETSLYHPGRVLALPKASYEAAIAGGAEPSSLSNQFDKNITYPSFVMNNILGPLDAQGNAFNLGSPVESLYGEFLNDYASHPTSMIGDVSPVIKAVPELMYGENFSTGRKIVDKSEYVDSALPVVNNLSAISGYSISGTVDNILHGAPALDPQRAVLRGEKENWLNTNLLNWFTGAGMQNYQKPSYLRIGLSESRQTGG